MSHKRKVQRENAPPKAVVDIVIPVYGQHEMLTRAVASITASKLGVPKRVIVVDDATPFSLTHETALDDLAEFPDVEVHRRKKNEGFIATCSAGVALGRAPIVVLMNSDVVLTSECLAHLLAPFSNSQVGVVGAKLLFPENEDDESSIRPAGRIQHAGIAFNTRKEPFHIHMAWSAEHQKVCTTKEMQAVTGALLATPRKLWDRLNGFDPQYGRGTFEDIDYCLRVRHGGFGVIYMAEAVAYHYANASIDGKPPEIMFPIKQNAIYFGLKMSNLVIWDEWRFW